jgi:sugar phosphate isomerase/epimerase
MRTGDLWIFAQLPGATSSHVQVPLGQGTLPLEEIATALKEEHWAGWAMNEEEREDGSKQGLAVIRPAFQALKGAFST